MGKNNFIGKFSGKYTKTLIEGDKIKNTKGKAIVTISKVGEDSYLISILEDGKSTINNLAFLKDDVLVSQAESGEGVTNTYFDGKHLIHQLSNKSSSTWIVKKYKFSRD
jgi:hypothetical protein